MQKRKREKNTTPTPGAEFTHGDEGRSQPERALSPEEIERQLASLGDASSEESEDSRLASPIGYVRKHSGLPATIKGLGQNWLLDAGVAMEMAARLGVKPGGLVVEVGPGPGALTEHLLAAGAEVIAVEIDRRMVDLLHERWAEEPRFTLLHKNILETDLHEATGGREFSLIGNLPYNITSSLLFALMDHAREHPGTLCRLMVMLQFEVAQRATALPGDSVYSKLAVFLRLWGDPELAMKVPKEQFTPPPKVDAGVIRMDVASEPRWPVPHYPTFRALVRGVFSKRRKMLRNTLPSIPHISLPETPDLEEALGFDLTRRPQTLSTEEFCTLAAKLVPKRSRHGND